MSKSKPNGVSNSIFYADKSSDKAYGVKLFEVEQANLEFCKEGKKVLSKLNESELINLCFIFGSARSGKSFLMNALAGVQGLFKVINSSTPCTRGVEISSYIPTYLSLAQHVNLAPNPKELKHAPRLGFVDVEGQGAEDGTYDTLLALPLLVTSKVVLFNHKGAPTVNDMLSKLGVLASAANYIEIQEEKEEKTLAQKFGDTVGAVLPTGKKRNAAEEVAPPPKKFGHLHVLFRDFSFVGTREEVYDQLMSPEKATKSMRAMGADNGVKERNDLRQLLQDNFQSISVWLFKQPASADDLSSHEDIPSNLVDPDFAQTVATLLTTIVQQTREPTFFNNKPLTAPRLISLLTQITASLNEGGFINVPSVFRAMEKETILRISNSVFTSFKRFLSD